MFFFKKQNNNLAHQGNAEPSAVLLYVTGTGTFLPFSGLHDSLVLDVRIPAHFKTHSHLRLEIADADRNNTNIKPRKVYQETPSERVDGPEVVLTVNRVIPINGTHLLLEIVELHTFHTNITLTKSAIPLMDILSILKQSDQEVVMYLIPNASKSVDTLLQQTVLSGSLIECLDRAEAAITLLSGLAGTLSPLHSTVQLILGLIKDVTFILQEQNLCYEKLSDLFEKMGSLFSYFQKIQKLKSFVHVQPVIHQILGHMKAALTIVLNDTRSNSLKQFFDFTIWSQQATKFSDLSSKFDKLLG
ncbi:hypothetical protein BDN72DRAFT_903517, partial [Pluteus cervinus]